MRGSRFRTSLGVALVTAASLAGCVSAAPGGAADRDTAGSHRITATPSPEQVRRSLATLRQVDDHPLYTMTYYGDYDLNAPSGLAQADAAPSNWACSVFAAYGAKPLVGRNFDFDPSPALLLFTDPPGGYASMSMVDVSYLNIDSPADLRTASGKQRLLGAPLLPFDGMNERGLAVTMAQVPDGPTIDRPHHPQTGSLRIIRRVLDGAATLQQALRIFRSFDIEFGGGPDLHYLVADAHGNSAIVEYVGGRMRVIRAETPWQVATNFNVTTASDAAKRAADRYHTASSTLAARQGALDAHSAMTLLERVRQEHTQWSIVYRLDTRTAHLATSQRYDRVHRFQL